MLRTSCRRSLPARSIAWLIRVADLGQSLVALPELPERIAGVGILAVLMPPRGFLTGADRYSPPHRQRLRAPSPAAEAASTNGGVRSGTSFRSGSSAFASPPLPPAASCSRPCRRRCREDATPRSHLDDHGGGLLGRLAQECIPWGQAAWSCPRSAHHQQEPPAGSMTLPRPPAPRAALATRANKPTRATECGCAMEGDATPTRKAFGCLRPDRTASPSRDTQL
mmetsp:Transcript_127779/g.367840  ORF Transcript_127779/g.367840 Transcript_127779/m.367840 type:complete len:224 (+) Transcript_127779:41-712(+)